MRTGALESLEKESKMATQTFDRPQTFETRLSERKNVVVPWISWSAIFGGLASGMATFILLALLGTAAGITAIDPQSAEPVGNVPMLAGIWTGVSMLLAAFIGGYVSARISGLSRRSDGILHGFVVWGVNTLLFTFLVTTSVGNLLGGVFSAVGKGAQAVATATGAAGGAAATQQGGGSLESLITGGGGGNISKESLDALQNRISAGDREGAIAVMTNQMGMTRDRAEPLADQAMQLQGAIQQLPSGQQIADTAVSGLTRASWWLFAGVLLSMILGVVGGFVGSKGVDKRRHALVAH
jgi:hypothetical protein